MSSEPYTYGFRVGDRPGRLLFERLATLYLAFVQVAAISVCLRGLSIPSAAGS